MQLWFARVEKHFNRKYFTLMWCNAMCVTGARRVRLSVCLCACTLGREVAHSVVQALCRPRTFIFASTVNETLSIACLRLAAVFTQCTIQYSTECVCSVAVAKRRREARRNETERTKGNESRMRVAKRCVYTIDVRCAHNVAHVLHSQSQSQSQSHVQYAVYYSLCACDAQITPSASHIAARSVTLRKTTLAQYINARWQTLASDCWTMLSHCCATRLPLPSPRTFWSCPGLPTKSTLLAIVAGNVLPTPM